MDEKLFAAARLGPLLGKIRDGLRGFLDSLNVAMDKAGDALPDLAVDSADVETASACLDKLGLGHDARRLSRSWDEILNSCEFELLLDHLAGKGCGPVRNRSQSDDDAIKLNKRRALARRLDGFLVQVQELQDLVDSVEAAIPPPKKPNGNADRSNSVTWQKAQDYLEECRLKGERFTSYKDFAERLVCGGATVHKAVQKGSVELQEWASKECAPSRLNTSPKTAAVALENVPQTREADPSEILLDEEADLTMDRLINQAEPVERARILALTPGEKRRLATAAAAHYADLDAEEADRQKDWD